MPHDSAVQHRIMCHRYCTRGSAGAPCPGPGTSSSREQRAEERGGGRLAGKVCTPLLALCPHLCLLARPLEQLRALRLPPPLHQLAVYLPEKGGDGSARQGGAGRGGLGGQQGAPANCSLHSLLRAAQSMANPGSTQRRPAPPPHFPAPGRLTMKGQTAHHTRPTKG